MCDCGLISAKAMIVSNNMAVVTSVDACTNTNNGYVCMYKCVIVV